jgi:hypothetical protein
LQVPSGSTAICFPIHIGEDNIMEMVLIVNN